MRLSGLPTIRGISLAVWFDVLSRSSSFQVNPVTAGRGFGPLFSSVSSSIESSSSSSSQALPPVIKVDGLTCSHDGGSVFQLDDVSYVLPRGQRVGLVGRNGCGKSTLLKILAESCCGTDYFTTRDDGVVYQGRIESARDVSVAFVEQEPPMPSDLSVQDALLGVTSSTINSSDGTQNHGVYAIVRRYRVAVARAEDDAAEFSDATVAMDRVGGWDVLTKAEEIATRLRVHHLVDEPLSRLSGGERKRVALAAALIRQPDVLLLDEPTNHLDLSAIRWLTELIARERKLTLLTVTHDRAFLEDICTSILELDRGKLYEYSNTNMNTADNNYENSNTALKGYSVYLQGKAQRLAIEDANVQSAKAKYRTELEWMRRQPQARQTKSKSRMDAFTDVEKATKKRDADPKLTLENSKRNRRIGNNVLKLTNVNLLFPSKTILKDFTYDFNRGDKIGIVGPNGVGKSTFIKVLTGSQSFDSGTLSTGETLVFGVYDQMGLELENEDERVLDFVRQRVEAGPGATMAEAPQEAMRLLKRFEFQRERWQERISMLSGGERRRLQLMSVLTKRPNFLILDEPTNDVDLDTLTALEVYLKEEFDGVLVVVSHDRYFTDKVTEHLFVFEGEGVVKDYMGTLSDYAECLVDQEKQQNSKKNGNASSSSSSVQGVGSGKEDKQKRMEKQNARRKMKREFDNLEPAIEKLKVKAATLQSEIDGSADEGWSVLAELTDKMNVVNDEIEDKEMRWLELAELLEEEE